MIQSFPNHEIGSIQNYLQKSKKTSKQKQSVHFRRSSGNIPYLDKSSSFFLREQQPPFFWGTSATAFVELIAD